MDQLANGFIDENAPGFDLVAPDAVLSERPRFRKLGYHTQIEDEEMETTTSATSPPFLLDAPGNSTSFVGDKCVHRPQYALGLLFGHA